MLIRVRLYEPEFAKGITEADAAIFRAVEVHVEFIAAEAMNNFIDGGSLVISNPAGMLLFIIVCLVRGRGGYRPAYYLLAGLGGLTAQTWYTMVRDWFTFSTPFSDRWAYEMGSALDAVLFLVAILLRMRYSRLEQDRVEREFREATYAADHDPLTRLVNRRGLDRWLATMPPSSW